MWKRLDESVSLSEKLAGLSWPALGTWMYLAAQTDTMGRFPRDARVVKAKCMTMRYDIRLEAVEEALLEIERAGLLHRYDADNKAYLVLHNAIRYNPPGALGHVSPKYPEPPADLCSCLKKERASGVRTPDVTSSHVTSTSPPEPEQPEFKGEAAQLAIAWIRGGGERCKKETAMNKIQAALDVGVPASDVREAFKAAKGEKIWEILDPLRERLKKSSVDGNKFRQADRICQNCGGSGSTVAGPCPGCKKGRELRRAQA